MKAITASWFLVTIKQDVEGEDGSVKRSSFQYVVDAMTFTECEARITEEVGGGDVVKEARAPFSEVFLSESEGRWYKVKVALITLDEKTGKEKKTSAVYLVRASSNENALKNVKSMLSDTDHDITDVVETKIVDVFHKE